MERSCDSCRQPYEAKLATSRYCGATCRKRGSRGADIRAIRSQAKAKAAPAAPKATRDPVAWPTDAPLPGLDLDAPSEPAADQGLVGAMRAELLEAGRLDTTLGQACLVLARRIDGDNADTGAAIASLTREMRATLTEAVKGAKVKQSSLESYRDELAARRQA